MMRRLAIALAVVAGGLTAVPGTATAGWKHPNAGSANNGWVTVDEAVYLTTAWAGAIRYHGGVLRWNVLRADPYSNGTGSPFRDVELGVRWRDGSLGRSWIAAPYDGITRPWPFHYTIGFYP